RCFHVTGVQTCALPIYSDCVASGCAAGWVLVAGDGSGGLVVTAPIGDCVGACPASPAGRRPAVAPALRRAARLPALCAPPVRSRSEERRGGAATRTRQR